jgi:hypothetical protein
MLSYADISATSGLLYQHEEDNKMFICKLSYSEMSIQSQITSLTITTMTMESNIYQIRLEQSNP